MNKLDESLQILVVLSIALLLVGMLGVGIEGGLSSSNTVAAAASPIVAQQQTFVSQESLTVTAVDPARGPADGSYVTVFGSGFGIGLQATVDSVLTAASIHGSDELTLAMPEHAPGHVQVLISYGGQQVSFMYEYIQY